VITLHPAETDRSTVKARCSGNVSALDLSVIIVNWNTGPLLLQCVNSVVETAGSLSLEVIIVDNGSSDDSLTMLPDPPQLKIINNKENLGFARANNQGFAEARGRYLLMLNPDTRVSPNALERMVLFLDRKPGAGALGPRLLNTDGSLQHSCSYFPSLLGVLMESLGLNRVFVGNTFFARWLMTSWDHTTTRQVDQPMGACLLLRAEALRQVGPLDERFFVYFEEVDLCFRLHNAGYKIYFLADAEVVHYGGQSSLGNLDVRITERYRSLLLYFAKHFSPGEIFCIRVMVLVHMLIRIAMLPFSARRFSTAKTGVSRRRLLSLYSQVIRLCMTALPKIERPQPARQSTREGDSTYGAPENMRPVG
jgi:N-acetylglucosaminyl-diphospho-decaprenol L-rhamnosyltransferase